MLFRFRRVHSQPKRRGRIPLRLGDERPMGRNLNATGVREDLSGIIDVFLPEEFATAWPPPSLTVRDRN